VLMTAMSGGSAGGDGGDDGQQPNKERRDSWNCHTIGMQLQKFHWNAEHKDTIRKYVMKDFGKKWREDRQTLWDKLCDPTQQKEHNYQQKPKKVDAAKWQTFVDHRMSKYMK
ncbi:hypothetical protein LINPERHAP2_LOCUS38185, partial [Linum perenne]